MCLASIAFSSEVGTGSREENASKQKSKALVPIQSEAKLLRGIARRHGYPDWPGKAILHGNLWLIP
jgi:hypothetical protein